MLQEMYSIQRLESEVDRVKKLIEDTKGDEELKRLKTEFHNLKETLDQFEKQVAENKARQEECGKQRKKIEKEISDYLEGRSEEGKTDEELKRLELHIAKQKEQLPQIDDRSLALERACDKLIHEETELKKKAKFIKDKFEKHKEELKIKINGYEKELESARQNLDAVMSIMSPEILDRYEELRITKQFPVAKVVGGACSGCNLVLAAELLEKVGVVEEESVCPSCGRMLVK